MHQSTLVKINDNTKTTNLLQVLRISIVNLKILWPFHPKESLNEIDIYNPLLLQDLVLKREKTKLFKQQFSRCHPLIPLMLLVMAATSQ